MAEPSSHPMPPPNPATITKGKRWGWTYRVNRVPHYQRLFQRHDGLRDWYKTPRSRYILYPFWAMAFTTLATSQYMMVRLMFGHKTFFGKD